MHRCLLLVLLQEVHDQMSNVDLRLAFARTSPLNVGSAAADTSWATKSKEDIWGMTLFAVFLPFRALPTRLCL